MKKTMFIFTVIIVMSATTQVAAAKERNSEILKRAFIEAMVHHIGKAVENHGTGRLWYRGKEEILEIKRPDPHKVTTYNVTIRVKTFKGPHNPPYAYETMTFQLPNMEVLDYDVEWQDN